MDVVAISTLVLTAIAAIAACCAPCMTALSNVIVFAGFRALRHYLQPPAVPAAISTNSQLVCKFEPINTV